MIEWHKIDDGAHSIYAASGGLRIKPCDDVPNVWILRRWASYIHEGPLDGCKAKAEQILKGETE